MGKRASAGLLARSAFAVAWLLGVAAFGGDIPVGTRPKPGQPSKTRPVVVVFDFVSDYDGGRMGTFVAKNVWAKLDRSKGCVLVNRGDVVDAVTEAKFVARFDAKPADIMKFATEEFGASRAVWGAVEQIDRAGPVSERRLRIRVRSASAEDKGQRLGVDFDGTVRNQRAIQVATKEAVRLFLQQERPAPDVGPEEEKRWRIGPNLVTNPGFEKGTDHPDFWEPISGDAKHPQHRCVEWVASPEGKGKCIRFTIPKDIAATYGVAYYSDPVSIQDGTIYRISVRVRSDGPAVKIFLKHYHFFKPGPNETKGQWRETRRAPMNCKGKPGEWATYTRDFRPHRLDHDGRFDPTITRIELYAYWPKGVVWFDDTVLKKLK